MNSRTLPGLFEESAGRYSDNIMLLEKTNDRYEGTSYRDARKCARLAAAGLIDSGLKKGDRVCLISEGRNAWVICELAILYAGAVNIPVSVRIEESADLEFRIRHSECCMAIVSGNQLEKIRKIQNKISLSKIIIIDNVAERKRDEITLEEIIERGRIFILKHEKEFEERLESLNENDYANICYTSGTTSDPKGIILTHRNYTSNIEQSSDAVKIDERDRILLILPWDHAFAHTCGIYTMIKNGGSIASVQTGSSPMETLKNIAGNLKETRPTVLISVPALSRSFRKNIERAINEKGWAVRLLFRFGLKIAYTYNSDSFKGKRGWRILLWPICRIFDNLIFGKVRENLGGRLKFFIGGGALLDESIQRFFYAIGIPMYQGYGLTEAGPVISANNDRKHKIGSSGTVVKDLEIIIRDENDNPLPDGSKGEITVRGENIMAGYWKNELATNLTVKNGWLYTGDIGYLDSDGFLYVLGRTKSLLISGDGEKFCPEGIEEALTENSRFISQVMLYNNQSPYTVALIVPERTEVLSWLASQNLEIDSEEGQNRVLKLIESEIKRVREMERYKDAFPARWFPSASMIIGEEFSEKSGMINSTMKMVRNRISEVYGDYIRFLYTAEGRNIFNKKNRDEIGRLAWSGS